MKKIRQFSGLLVPEQLLPNETVSFHALLVRTNVPAFLDMARKHGLRFLYDGQFLLH